MYKYNYITMKLFFRKVLRVVLIGFVLLALFLVSWLGYYLTTQEDGACGEPIIMIKKSNHTENDEELQRVLDNYSCLLYTSDAADE